MWEQAVGCSWGSVTLGLTWVLGFSMIGASASLGVEVLAHAGIGICGLAAALTVIRDNTKSRRLLRTLVRDQREERALRSVDY